MRLSVIAGGAALASVLLLSGIVLAQSNEPVHALRGADLDITLPAPEAPRQQQGRATRNYRQQPPIIPHEIDNYQIDKRTNQCLSCHDWTVAGDRGAPTLSMTHYLDRDREQLDTVAGTRWFCNQCHVPQADTPDLVGNSFKASNTLN